MRTLTLLFFFCLTLLVLPATASATDVVQSWAQTYGITSGESPDIFSVDSKGSIYIASIEKFSDFGNWWVIRKLNSLGQFQWSQTFFATGIPQDMAVDANGNLFITSTMQMSYGNAALTVKLSSNGDLAWVQEFPGGTGQSIHLDSAGNVFEGGTWSDGGTSQLLLLEYSTAGGFLNSVKFPEIVPGPTFFMPNGNLVANGFASGTQNPFMEVVSPTGTVVFGLPVDNTASDFFNYLLTCDPSSNLYLVIHDNHSNTSDSFIVVSFSPTGATNWESASYPGMPQQVTASDINHAYLQVITGPNTYVINGFKAFGQRFMNVQAQPEVIAADGSKGLVIVTENTTAYTYSEINADLVTLWSQTYSGAKPLGSLSFQVINSTVYCLNQTILNEFYATNFIKFVQGVGVTAVTPAAPQIQGGKSVNVTVQLNDVAPAAGLNVYFVSNSSALGLPSSLVIPAGKSSLTVTALTDPVDVAVTVSIAAEVNGGIRNTTIVLNPATLSTVTFPGGTNPTVVGGKTIIGTITLTGPTALLAHTVTLSSNSAKATVPASVNVIPGASTATFVVSTTAVTANTPVVVTAKLAGVTVTAKLTITP